MRCSRLVVLRGGKRKGKGEWQSVLKIFPPQKKRKEKTVLTNPKRGGRGEEGGGGGNIHPNNIVE